MAESTNMKSINKGVTLKESITVDIFLLHGLPINITGVSMPGTAANRYKIGLNEDITETQRLAAFLHEMTHIYNRDHEPIGDVIEKERRTKQQLIEALELLKDEC